MSAQLQSDDIWSGWRAELAGQPRALAAGEFMHGFFECRTREGRLPLRLWLDEDGDWVARLGTKEDFIADDRFAENVFSRSKAIPSSVYDAVMAGKGWPDEVALPAATSVEPANDLNPHADQPNTPPAEHVLIEDERIELFRSAKAWLDSIGGKVTMQEHADAAAKIAEKAGELDKRAKEGKRVEKKPSLDEAARLEKIWAPVVKNCTGTLRWSKGLAEEFLKAEVVRKAAVAAAKAAEGKAVTIADMKVKAGSGRGVSLTTRQDVVVDDLDALLAHLITTPPFRDDKDVVVLARRHAFVRLQNGLDVPGARIVDITGAR